MIEAEFFYSTLCKDYGSALCDLKEVLDRVKVKYRLEIRTLLTDGDARRWKVKGCPSVRINGKDVENAGESPDYGLKCRTYKEGQKTLYAPSKAMILRAISEELPDPMICYCKGVRRSAILDALRNGAKTFKDVQKITGASTGNECETKNPTGKCCSPFVVEVIKAWEGRQCFPALPARKVGARGGDIKCLEENGC